MCVRTRKGQQGSVKQCDKLVNSKDCCCSVVFYMALISSIIPPHSSFMLHWLLTYQTTHFIGAPHSFNECSNITINVYKDNYECMYSDRIEWVHCSWEVLATHKSMMDNMLSCILIISTTYPIAHAVLFNGKVTFSKIPLITEWCHYRR